MDLFQKKNPLYPDRTDNNLDWIKVLPVDGRPLQTAEFIEMQSIQHHHLKAGLNTLFDSGTILSGLEARITNTTSEDITISISEGKIYIEGIVVNVSSNLLTVSRSGEYNIGVLINNKIITEKDDPTLRDPIKKGAIYGLEGASRLIWKPIIVLDETDAFTIARVIDGNIVQKSSNVFSQIDKILSKYTYERSGNFCVEGFDITVLPIQERAIADRNKYNSLAEASNNARINATSALLDANQSLTRLNNLKEQLNNAISTAELSPTSQNLSSVEQLRNLYNQEEALYNQLARLVVSKQTLYNKSQEQFLNAQSLLVDKVLFSISPGTAYVEGYRINKNSPTILVIPKELDTTKVESASFTYLGKTATTQRLFSLSPLSTFAEVKNENTLLSINVQKVLYNQQFVEIKIELAVNISTINSIDNLLDFLVLEFNKNPDVLPSPQFKINSSLLGLSPTLARTILKSNIIIYKTNEEGLIFESTSQSDTANQIGIEIKVSKRNSSNLITGESQKLLVDISKSNLAGAGRYNNFRLGFRPVDEIVSLVAELEENLKPLIRGRVGTSDKLGDDSVFRISKVIQGSRIYVEGRDYQLINNSEIDWSLNRDGSIEPNEGTTYYVSFLYTQPLAIDKDFILDKTTDSINFIGTTPASNASFFVTYTYYLAVSGVITLNSKGEFSYILSPSAASPVPPVTPKTDLEIGTFKLFANTTEFTKSNCRAITFAELNQLASLIQKNSCNIEVLKLDTTGYRQAINSIGKQPIGLFTNTLIDLTRLDINHPLFTGSVVPSIQALSAGYIHKDVPIKYQEGGALSKNIFNEDYFVTLLYTTNTLLTQERLTTARAVNPITTINKRGTLCLSNQYNFKNESFKILNPYDLVTNTTTFLSRTISQDASVQSISSNIKLLFKGVAESISQSLVKGNPISSFGLDTNTYLGYINSQVKAKTVTLQLRAQVKSNTEGYRLFFAGVEIKKFNLLSGTALSAQYPGTIKANSEGLIHLQFDTPADLRSGSHSCEVKGPQGYCISDFNVYNNLATQIVLGAIHNWDESSVFKVAETLPLLQKGDYFDEPILNGSSSLINVGVVPSVERPATTESQKFPILHDSLSQTFEVPDCYFLKQIKLKLKKIHPSGSITVKLKTALQEPLKSVLGVATSTLLSPSEKGEVWTVFEFPYPILINSKDKYCIAIETTHNGFELFTASVGEADLRTGSLIGDQFLLKGTLYSTKDGITLSNLNKEDLTYELARTYFDISKEVLIPLGKYGSQDNISNIYSFCLNSRDIIPLGTSIIYEYKISTEWVQFSANHVVALSVPVQNVEIRAKLRSSKNNISPTLMLQGSSVSLYSALLNSTIISKQVVYSNSYKSTVISFQYIQPTFSNIRVYYSPTDGNILEGPEWIELTRIPSTFKYIDESLKLAEVSYSISHPTNVISNNLPRVKFRYRIDISAPNGVAPPIIRNIITYTY